MKKRKFIFMSLLVALILGILGTIGLIRSFADVPVPFVNKFYFNKNNSS